MRSSAIKKNSSTTIAEQFANSIREKILRNQFKPDAPLDPVRDVAKRNGINPMTVCSAIKVLKEEGLLVTAGAKGTFVAAGAREILQERIRMRTRQLLRETFGQIQSLGVPIAELKCATAAALKEYGKGR